MKAQLHVVSTNAAESENPGQIEPISHFPSSIPESSAGRSRQMLLPERTMYRDGLTPFTSLFTLRLRGELSEPRLCHALARMQARHPLLRCVVEEAADGPRFVLSGRPAPVPLRIAERKTDHHWESEARREWLTPFGCKQDPLVRLVWLRGQGVHELMLVAHHCICDGPSGISLLRDCFAAYDNPRGKPDAYESLGAIEDFVPEGLLADRAFWFRTRRRSALLRLALRVKARRRPAQRGGPSADAMYFHRWQLDRLAAGILIESCRRENVTVLSAVAAAVLQAFREIRGAGSLKHAFTMVNARRFMPRAHPDALFGMAPGVEIPIPKKSVSTFWEGARAIREHLAKRIDRLGARFYEYMLALETLHDRYPQLIADTETAPIIRHVTFSNLGKLDLPQQYRSFVIEHIYSPLVMVSPSPANTVVLSSFGGIMEFSIISDEVSLPQAQASAIQERAMAILCTSAAIAAQDHSAANRDDCAKGMVTA